MGIGTMRNLTNATHQFLEGFFPPSGVFFTQMTEKRVIDQKCRKGIPTCFHFVFSKQILCYISGEIVLHIDKMS